jgi:type II secretory pathway pseudopilin PulG
MVGVMLPVAVVLTAVVILGIVAAIAIPSLYRARVAANEAATIGDIRALLSAEAAYQSANAGFYAEIECLATPSACLPSYPATAPTFLDSGLAQPDLVKNGYRRRFVAVQKVAESQNVGKRSLADFRYEATPVEPGQSGVRGFAGDASGRVCFTLDGSVPEMKGTCNVVQ